MRKVLLLRLLPGQRAAERRTVLPFAGGESSAGEIGGETILVKIGSVRRFFGVYRGKSLKAESIEGTHVTLACAKAKIVRGETVVLGPGCDIDRVEYSKQLTVHEKARVRERVEVRVG